MTYYGFSMDVDDSDFLSETDERNIKKIFVNTSTKDMAIIAKTLIGIVKERQEEEKRKERLAYFGDPNYYREGTIVAFRYKYPHSSKWYKYAAILTNGFWYTTGPKSPKAYTWDEFADWLCRADAIDEFGLVATHHYWKS